MELSYLLNTIRQEKSRIEYMLGKYLEQIENMPKGNLYPAKRNGNTYYYLKYRDGQKVISKYVREKELDKVRADIEKRNHIEAMVKSLKEELAVAEKALEGNI